MTMKEKTAFVMFSIFFFLFFAVPVNADLYWQNVQETKGVPGQSDEVQIVDHYFSKNASRTEIGKMTTIMNFTDMTLYQLDMTAKTYSKIDLNTIG